MMIRFIFIHITLLSFLFATPVSNLNGELKVNNSILNYEIPLNLPEGISGVKPNLSLTYNSNGGNGYLGVGWSINGANSIITRCSQNKLIDGQSHKFGINYDENDRFCLDGQRLISDLGVFTQTDYGKDGTEYKTRIDIYSKIISHETYNQGGPKWFEVMSKDGSIYKYGLYKGEEGSGSAYLIVNGRKAFWRLSQIEDRYHNKINFHYKTDYKKGESYISKITYAHNSIEFVYENRKDKQVSYSGGHIFNLSVRLKKIVVKSNDKVLRSYHISYLKTDPNDNRSFISSIKEIAAKQSIKPITFTYQTSDKSFFKQKGTIPYFKRDMFFVDFDSDGIVDQLKVTKKYFIFSKGDGQGSFTETTKFKHHFYNHLQFADINNDGYIDIYAEMTTTDVSDGMTFVSKARWYINKGEIGKFKTKDLDIQYGRSGQEQAFGHIGDFNGDGINDILKIYQYKDNQLAGIAKTQIDINYFTKSGTYTTKTVLTNLPIQLSVKSPLKIVDLNKDGLSDIYIVKNDEDIIYINKGFGKFKKYTINMFASSSDILFGDFNGDGAIDIYEVNGKKRDDAIWINNGKGKFALKYHTKVRTTFDKLRVFDINGDGKSDILTTKHIWLNDGCCQLKIVKDLSIHKLFNLTDINGDGFIDIVEKGGDLRILLNTHKPKLLKTIKDSFDNIHTIQYKPLSSKDIYHKAKTHKNNSINIVPPGYAVSRITSPTPTAQKSITSYQYSGFRVHTDIGSLGFEKIITKNNLSKTRIEVYYNQQYPFIGMPKSTKTYINNNLISKEIIKYTKKYRHKIYQVSISSKETRSYQDDNLLKRITIKNKDIDDYGNIGTIIETITDETTGDEFITTTENIYENDESSWILSRLTRAEVTKEAYGDTQTRVSRFEYDEDTGILIKETIESGNNINSIINTISDNIPYIKHKDTNINIPIETNNEDDLSKEYIYDSKGRKIQESIVSANGEKRTTKYEYNYTDNKHLVITTINPLGWQSSIEYNLDGQPIKSTDINGFINTTEYDAFGKKIAETSMVGTPLEIKRRYIYKFSKEFGGYYYIEIKEDASPPQRTYYNSLGMQIASKSIARDNKVVLSYIKYDALGRVVKKSMPYFQGDTPVETIRKYDIFGRLIYEKVPAPEDEEAEDTIEYDGYTITHTNGLGQKKIELKNALEKTVKIQEPLGAEIEYSYDAMGNLVKTTDAQGNEITIAYDNFGRKIQQNDPDMGTWYYKYNVWGDLISQTDANGITTYIYYDKLGRKTKEVSPDNTSLYIYDKSFKGAIYESKNANASTKFIYDNYGRIIKQIKTIKNQELITTYQYDRYSRVTQKHIGSLDIVYDYTQNGYLDAIKSPREEIDDFDEDKLVDLVAQTLNNSLEYYKKQLEYEDRVKELLLQATYYEKIVKKYQKYKKFEKHINILRKSAQLLRKSAKKYKYYAKKYKNKSKYYKKKSDYYIKIAKKSNLFSTLIYKSLARKYKYYAKKYAYWSAYYLKKTKSATKYATIFDDFANKVEVNSKLYDEYKKKAQQALAQAKEAQQQAQNFANLANDNATASKAYQEMLDDSKYSYFYKVLSSDASGHITKYVSGNGLITQDAYDSVGALNRTTTGYLGEKQLRDVE